MHKLYQYWRDIPALRSIWRDKRTEDKHCPELYVLGGGSMVATGSDCDISIGLPGYVVQSKAFSDRAGVLLQPGDDRVDNERLFIRDRYPGAVVSQ